MDRYLIHRKESLTPSELKQIAELHRSSLPWTVNSSLGLDHLERVYEVCLNQKNFLLFTAEINNRIIGVASATVNYQNLKKYLKNSLPKKYYLAVLKISPFKLTKSFIVNRKIDKLLYDVRCVFLLSWYVKQEYKKYGVGKKLLSAIENECTVNEIDIIYVDVHEFAKEALYVYPKVGFKYILKIMNTHIFMKRIFQ